MAASSGLAQWKFVAPEFIFGPGCALRAGAAAANLGMERVLLVTDPGIEAAGLLEGILDSLAQAGVEHVLHDGVSPNPRAQEVMRGLEVFRAHGCDGLLAVGGGSAMDAAKGIGIASSNDLDILAFEGVDKVERPSPPLICIPTTAGTSADVSQFAIILDPRSHIKIAIVSKAVVPDTALIDPAMTLTMPETLTVHTGLDALTHAVEAYASTAHNPVTDSMALAAIKNIVEHLPKARLEPENLEHRTGMMLGSLQAGLAFSNAILGAVHAMAHSLGGLLDLPHGLCNAILLDHVVEANHEAAPDRHAHIALALGNPIPPGMPLDEARQHLRETIAGFKRGLGLTQRLGSLGVTMDNLDELARHALDDPCMITNPRVFTHGEVVQLYASAL